MITRSKPGIHKPKTLKITTDYTFKESPTYAIAAKYPQWVAAMDSEFQSLQKQ